MPIFFRCFRINVSTMLVRAVLIRNRFIRNRPSSKNFRFLREVIKIVWTLTIASREGNEKIQDLNRLIMAPLEGV